MELLLDPCPACQLGHLEPYGSKMCCTNTRCYYTETCSDGSCGMTMNLEGKKCESCGRMIYGTLHNCPGEPEVWVEPPSTAESDYRSLHDDLSQRPNDGSAELQH